MCRKPACDNASLAKQLNLLRLGPVSGEGEKGKHCQSGLGSPTDVLLKQMQAFVLPDNSSPEPPMLLT